MSRAEDIIHSAVVSDAVLTVTVGYGCHDVGNADRFVTHHGEDVRYLPEADRWYVWNGVRWEADRDGEVWRRAKLTAATIELEAAAASGNEQAEKALKAHAKYSRGYVGIRNML